MSENGIQFAQDAANLIKAKGLNITAIVSSPLNRAIQTANIIAKYLNLPTSTLPLIKERASGEAEWNRSSKQTNFHTF